MIKFVTVMVGGELIGWTGRNPDEHPESLIEATLRARELRKKENLKDIPDRRAVIPVVVQSIEAYEESL